MNYPRNLLQNIKFIHLLLLFLIVLLQLPWLGNRLFSTRGEAREALVAQEIHLQGEWILPAGYGGTVPSKPPLMHWIIAGFSELTGAVTETTARLPSALGATLFTILYFIFLSREGASKRESNVLATLTVIILSTSPEWFRSAAACRVDMLLSVFVAGGLLCLFCWIEQRAEKALALGAILLGLAILTKGPVGIVLPAGIIFIYMLFRGERWIYTLIAVAKFSVPAAIIGGSWYVVAYLSSPQAFYDKFYYENIARFISTMEDDPHSHSIAYLMGALFTGFFPWSCGIVPLFPKAASWLRQHWRSSLQKMRDLIRRDQFLGFSILTAFLIFIFFSIPDSKRSVYLLPSYPFLSYIIARAIILSKAKVLSTLKIVLVALGVLYTICTLTVILIILFGVDNAEPLINIFSADSQWYAESILLSFEKLGFFSALLLLLPILIFLIYLWRLTLVSSGLFIFSLLLVFNVAISPSLNDPLSEKQFALLLKNNGYTDGDLYSFGFSYYGLSFYMQKQINNWSEQVKINDYVLLPVDSFAKFRNSLPRDKSWHVITNSGTGIVKSKNVTALIKIIKASGESDADIN